MNWRNESLFLQEESESPKVKKNKKSSSSAGNKSPSTSRMFISQFIPNTEIISIGL